MGKVDKDGIFYRGTGWSRKAVGKVDDNGIVNGLLIEAQHGPRSLLEACRNMGLFIVGPE